MQHHTPSDPFDRAVDATEDEALTAQDLVDFWREADADQRRRCAGANAMLWRNHFPSEASAEEFWQTVKAAVTKHLGPMVDSDSEAGTVILGNGGTLSVHNIANDIQSTTPEEQAEHVDWWVRQLAKQQPEALEAHLARWSQVKGALRMRLMLSPFPENMIGTAITDELMWCAAIVVPNGAVPAPRDHLERWGVSAETVLFHADRNTKRRHKVGHDLTRTFGRPVHRFRGDLFATGALTRLDQHLGALSEHGALIMAPTSHYLLAVPVRDLDERIAEDAAALFTSAVHLWSTGSHQLPLAMIWVRSPQDMELAVIHRPFPGRPFFVDIVAPEPMRSLLERGEQLHSPAA